MKTKLIYLIMGLGLVFTLSCTKYPPSSDRLLEDLVVTTQYDTKVNFSDYKTYSIADTIKKITDKGTTSITGPDAQAIFNQIDKNMKARGFVPAVAPQKPDFGIQVTYLENTTVYTYYYDYWGYYYPYYPYYPVYYSSYTTGLGNIELIDLKNVNGTQVYIRWNAYIRGLMTGTHTNAEILSRIDQAFIQTPQLVTTAK
jgi:hypothetical protein